MRWLRYIFSLAGILIFSHSAGQVTGEWLGAEIEFDLPKKFSIETGFEARALNPGGIHFYKYLVQAGLNYKIHKHFDATFKYRYTWRIEENMHYYPRQRLMLDLKADYPVERFKFDYRARFQRITKSYVNNELDLVPTMHLRNKLKVSYDVKRTKILPAVFVEVFTPLNSYAQGPVEEVRIGADVRYPIADNQSITGGIMYIHEQFETLASGIIFSIGYKISVF